MFVFFKQKTAYELRISDWSSDVCSSDLIRTLLLTLLYRQMPELVERGHIYIAQPPLYKVKVGREERYLKDDAEEAQFMLQVALKDAALFVKEGSDPISGDALAELARQYILADSVINRLSRTFDIEALSAMAEGVEINLTDADQAAASAQRLFKAIDAPAVPNVVTVNVEANEEGDAWRLVLNRMTHAIERAPCRERVCKNL